MIISQAAAILNILMKLAKSLKKGKDILTEDRKPEAEETDSDEKKTE